MYDKKKIMDFEQLNWIFISLSVMTHDLNILLLNKSVY